jgi:ubiquinone/menaquinone biosynthesis C-methylase UbiE
MKGTPHNRCMPWFTTVSAAKTRHALRFDLSQRLQKLQRVFAVPQIQGQALAAADVAAYYEQCFDAYRKYHSNEGAVHMALNDGGRFDADGFYGQLRRLETAWRGPGGETAALKLDVLELAFGQGFNLAYLAPRHAGCRFSGIDLTPRHLDIASQRLQTCSNTNLRLGNFHQLPYADASFDQLFCIEAFCYADDLPQALSEVARVLRPGGKFTLFDGYLTRPVSQMDAEETLAVDLLAKGMAINSLQVVDELLAAGQAQGLRTTHLETLDDAIMPSLHKLQRLTGAVIRWPWLGRRALARRSAMRGRNVLAGYLMKSTVQLGLIGYRHIVLQKES